MSWETRKGKGRYYTRSHRVNGRIVREYLGAGELAALCAELDQEERKEREAKREAEREELERLATLDDQVRAYCADVDKVLRETLTAAGYHQHTRGEWRKRRHGDQEQQPAGGSAEGEP